ncbi:MAG TPA: EamA family transporter [Casimicrobiaceae bacterium]|jgi:drug/metabolite transporter (DMT)-like permease|nr:EamA family transporter [Casimicrobiaceae bacterium]
MTWTAFAFLLSGVLLNAAAQLFLKAGTNALGVITLTRENWIDQFGRLALEPHLAGGILCYAVSVVVWIIGLSRVPVSIAYPMLSLGYIINAIAAHYLLGEAVTLQRWLGIGFIIVGVWLVARS